jgi:hypothetical protein
VKVGFLRCIVLACGLVACEVVDIGDPAPPSPAEAAPNEDPPLLPAPAPAPEKHWELANPRPAGVDLYGVWGQWLVGQAGTVLRFDGTRTTPAFTGPVDDDYFHVWASSDDDVWIGGRRGRMGHVVLHGEKGVFTKDPILGSRTLHALFGFAKNDVWAAVDDGRMMHFDGTTWKERFHTPDGKILRAVWGSGPKDLWTAGDNGALYRFDGTTFATYTFAGASPDDRFYGIWGPSPTDVWASFNIASTTKMAHFDGTRWSQDEWPVVGFCFTVDPDLSAFSEPRGRGMWGVKTGDQVVIMASRGGRCRLTLEMSSTWKSPWEADVPEQADFTDMWGDRIESFFSVGREGRIVRMRGYNPGVTTTPVFPGRRDQLTGVSIGTDGEIWARGNDSTPTNDELYRWTDLGWTPVVGVPPGLGITAVGVRSAKDVWIALQDVLRHWNGSTWDQEIFLQSGAFVEDFTFGPAGDGWAVGNAIWRLSSGKWIRVPTPTSQHSTKAWSLGPNDVWFSTSDWKKGGEVLHWDGKAITSVYQHPANGGLWGVWASSPTDVFVSGNVSVHWDGKTWTEVPVAASFGVWGSDPQHVYFGAWVPHTEAAQIVKWDGTRAEVVARHWAGRTPLMFAGSKDVGFAVGDYGLTFRLTQTNAPPK